MSFKKHSEIGLFLLARALITAPDNEISSSKKDSFRFVGADETYASQKQGPITLTDPFRNLENSSNWERKRFIDRNNQKTQDYLDNDTTYINILRELQNTRTERIKWPFIAGQRAFIMSDYDRSRNQTLQYPALFYSTIGAEDKQFKMIFNPSDLGLGVDIVDYVPSPDGSMVALGISEKGSDDESWLVVDTETRKTIDKLEGLMEISPSWSTYGSGLYYLQYPKNSREKGVYRDSKIIYHELPYTSARDSRSGDYFEVPQPSSEHIEYTNEATHANWKTKPIMSQDGTCLVLEISQGAKQNRIHYIDLRNGQHELKELIPDFDNVNTFLGNDGPILYFKTDRSAPRGQVIAINIDETDPVKKYTTIIKEDKQKTLFKVAMVGGVFIANYLIDGHSQVDVVDKNGIIKKENVELPGIGSVGDFSGGPHHQETLFYFTNEVTPLSIYRLNLKNYKISPVHIPKLKIANAEMGPEQFETKLVFYPSKDGTSIPLQITAKKDIKMDGSNPTLMMGYGGFGTPMKPAFSKKNFLFLQRGGILAVPLVRGGGDKGENWHKAAVGVNRQVSFDDFIAAAEWLINNKYTCADKLAAEGSSNGGLLVMASALQRPNLFKAIITNSAVLDMVRFNKTDLGRGEEWVTEFGDPQNPRLFDVLHTYSPYEKIKNLTRQNLPAILLTGGLNDKNVRIAHSLKMKAAIDRWEKQNGPTENPYLLAISETGHKGASSLDASTKEAALKLTFLAKNLGMR